MILRWKNNGALESTATWQGFYLVVRWATPQHPADPPASWRLAIYNAALVPDGTFVKGSWPSMRAAQEYADAVAEKFIECEARRNPPPSAKQRMHRGLPVMKPTVWSTPHGDEVRVKLLDCQQRVTSTIIEGPSVRAMRSLYGV